MVGMVPTTSCKRRDTMAFQHLALIKFPRELAAEDLDFIHRVVESWSGEIPGLQSAVWGTDVSGRSQGYQVALVLRFASADAAHGYQPHPRHQELVRWIQSQAGEVLAFDFPIPDPSR
jgi:hypothetical protein